MNAVQAEVSSARHGLLGTSNMGYTRLTQFHVSTASATVRSVQAMIQS